MLSKLPFVVTRWWSNITKFNCQHPDRHTLYIYAYKQIDIKIETAVEEKNEKDVQIETKIDRAKETETQT